MPPSCPLCFFLCAAGAQVSGCQEDAGEEAEAEPPDPAVDPHAHGQPHSVSTAPFWKSPKPQPQPGRIYCRKTLAGRRAAAALRALSCGRRRSKVIAAVWFHEITAGSKNMGAHATFVSFSFRLSGFIRRPQLLLLLLLRRHCGRLASPYCSSPCSDPAFLPIPFFSSWQLQRQAPPLAPHEDRPVS